MTRNQYAPSKSPTFHVIKIAGNGRGCAGLGIGRAASYKDAAKKAEYMAAANMIYVPRYRNHTIAHTLFGKFHRLRYFQKFPFTFTFIYIFGCFCKCF